MWSAAGGHRAPGRAPLLTPDPLRLNRHRAVRPQGKNNLFGVSLECLPDGGQLSKPLSS